MGLVYLASDCHTASYGTVLRLLDRSPAVLGSEFGYRWLPEHAQPSIAQLEIARTECVELIRRWWPELEFDAAQHPDAAHLWRHLCATASPERPVIVDVDCFDLPHSTHYQRMHLAHKLVVVAASDAEVTVIDGYRGASYAGAMDPQLIRASLATPAATESGPPTSVTSTVCVTAARAEPDPVIVAQALRDSADQILSDRDTPVPQGRRATSALASFLRAHTHEGALDDLEFVEILARLSELSSQRSVNAECLVLAAKLLGAPQLLGAAQHASEAARMWMMMRNMFYLRAVKSRSVPDSLAVRMQRCFELEVAAAELIVAALADPTQD